MLVLSRVEPKPALWSKVVSYVGVDGTSAEGKPSSTDVENGMLVHYLGNGAYTAYIMPPSLGIFELTLFIGLGDHYEQIGRRRRMEVGCMGSRKPLFRGSLYCGVEAGYELSNLGDAVPCAPGYSKASMYLRWDLNRDRLHVAAN